VITPLSYCTNSEQILKAHACGTSRQLSEFPGNAINAKGLPFNPSRQAGTVYAGNPGTPSTLHANRTAAVSQYDVACAWTY